MYYVTAFIFMFILFIFIALYIGNRLIMFPFEYIDEHPEEIPKIIHPNTIPKLNNWVLRLFN